ncbi:angiopoietin-2-like [Branchiostoma lanceolatum]|uniref:angiopoietin-2-like n=1 Tax=Branchiostoma lanceolatum TaxID=7740 RepID=UPI003452C92A
MEFLIVLVLLSFPALGQKQEEPSQAPETQTQVHNIDMSPTNPAEGTEANSEKYSYTIPGPNGQPITTNIQINVDRGAYTRLNLPQQAMKGEAGASIVSSDFFQKSESDYKELEKTIMGVQGQVIREVQENREQAKLMAVAQVTGREHATKINQLEQSRIHDASKLQELQFEMRRLATDLNEVRTANQRQSVEMEDLREENANLRAVMRDMMFGNATKAGSTLQADYKSILKPWEGTNWTKVLYQALKLIGLDKNTTDSLETLLNGKVSFSEDGEEFGTGEPNEDPVRTSNIIVDDAVRKMKNEVTELQVKFRDQASLLLQLVLLLRQVQAENRELRSKVSSFNISFSTALTYLDQLRTKTDQLEQLVQYTTFDLSDIRQTETFHSAQIAKLEELLLECCEKVAGVGLLGETDVLPQAAMDIDLMPMEHPMESDMGTKFVDKDYGIVKRSGLPRDCSELYEKGKTMSGRYYIRPDNSEAFAVYCDMETAGGGWTVIQRRSDGLVDFSRTWDQYRTGFGVVIKDHWLGNNKIYTILKQGTYSLRFDLGSWQGQQKFAEYENFTLENEDRNYALHIHGYSGSAGDAFIEVHNNQPFSTKDRVQELKHNKGRATCAETYKGGWWYRDDWCYNTNLNGVYYVNGNYSSAQADGVTWVNWLGYWYSLKTTEMKIRPASFMGKSTET